MTGDGRVLAALLLLRQRDAALAEEALARALRQRELRVAALARARANEDTAAGAAAQAREEMDALARTGATVRDLAVAAARIDHLRGLVRLARVGGARAAADVAVAEGSLRDARVGMDRAMAGRKVVEERLAVHLAADRRLADERADEEAGEVSTARRPGPRGAQARRRG